MQEKRYIPKERSNEGHEIEVVTVQAESRIEAIENEGELELMDSEREWGLDAVEVIFVLLMLQSVK